MDRFPVDTSVTRSVCAAIRGKRKGRQSGPRKIVRSETPSALFSREWDYSSDQLFGPIFDQLKNGQKVEYISICRVYI